MKIYANNAWFWKQSAWQRLFATWWIYQKTKPWNGTLFSGSLVDMALSLDIRNYSGPEGKSDDASKMYISNFYYLWPKIRSLLWPPITPKSTEEIPTALVWQSINSLLSPMCIHSIHSPMCCSISWLKIGTIFLASDFCNMHFWSYDVTRGQQQVFSNHFWLGCATVFKLPAMRLSCSGESTNMQHDLFNSGQDLDLRSNFKIYISVKLYNVYHSMRLKERKKKKLHQVPCSYLTRFWRYRTKRKEGNFMPPQRLAVKVGKILKLTFLT